MPEEMQQGHWTVEWHGCNMRNHCGDQQYWTAKAARNVGGKAHMKGSARHSRCMQDTPWAPSHTSTLLYNRRRAAAQVGQAHQFEELHQGVRDCNLIRTSLGTPRVLVAQGMETQAPPQLCLPPRHYSGTTYHAPLPHGGRQLMVGHPSVLHQYL